MHTKTAIAISAFVLLAGCGPGTKLGSIAGGQCSLPGVQTPQYKVLGKRQFDQNWIDETTEGLVRGCNMERPKARPASLDRPKKTFRPKAKAVPVSEKSVTPAPETKPKKRHWWQRKTS